MLRRLVTIWHAHHLLGAFVLLTLPLSVLAKPDPSFYARLYAPFLGDLEEMQQRRMIRVLVTPTRTNFFFDGDRNRGLEYELLKSYERYLNRGPRKRRYYTQLIFIPSPFTAILEGVQYGYGDIGAAGLTVTPERAQLVDFTLPYIRGIREILVTNKNMPAPRKLQDLAGKQIVLVRGSSYVQHVTLFNQALARLNLPLMEIVQAEPELDAEDLLELLNQGLIEYTVVDSHIAHLWARVLPNIRPQDDFAFHYGGKIAWAVRKNNPHLKRSLNQFIRRYARPGKLLHNLLYRRYFRSARWLREKVERHTIRRFFCYKPLFQLMGDFFDLEWTMLAAVAFTESHFDPRKRSKAGAYGLMQVRRPTARKFGITNLFNPFDNILAGAAYLRWLQDVYFSDPRYSRDDRVNFTLAAYNAGPGRIRQMQKLARKQGLNPYVWFHNVEAVARNHIGTETVDYITKVRKTRTALLMTLRLVEKRRKAKASLSQASSPTLLPIEADRSTIPSSGVTISNSAPAAGTP